MRGWGNNYIGCSSHSLHICELRPEAEVADLNDGEQSNNKPVSSTEYNKPYQNPYKVDHSKLTSKLNPHPLMN